jgi:lipopolysaccharide exporter
MNRIRQVLKGITKNELVKNSAFLISSNGLAQIVTFLLYPFVARLYTPGEFGQLAILLSINSLIVTGASGRYELAITLPKSETQASDLFVIGLRIAIVVSLLVAPVVFIIQMTGLRQEFGPPVTIWFYLMGIIVFLAAYQQLINSWCVRYKLFNIIAVSTLVLGVSNSVLKLLLGFLKTHDGLFYSFFIAMFLTTLYLFLRTRKTSSLPPFFYRSSSVLDTAKTYVDFPKFNMANALINTFSGNLPVYALSLYFTENLTGQFSIAFALLFRPVITYNNSVYQVLMQKLVEMRHARKAIWPLVRSYILRTMYLSIIPAIALIFLVPWLISMYLGENWTEAGRFCQLMLPYALLTLIGGSLTFVPNMFNRQLDSLVINIIYLILRIGALVAGVVTDNVYVAVSLFALAGIMIFTYQIFWYRKLLMESDRMIYMPEPVSSLYPHGNPENLA